MIVTAGLTPAWQHILEFPALNLGDVNRASAVHWCASGKVLNAAIALRYLEAPAKAVTFVGGDTGRAIEADLKRLGVSAELVECQAPTRVCTTLVDRSGGPTTELVENAQPVTDAELEKFASVFAAVAQDAAVVLLIGSLPEGAPSTYYQRLIRSCQGRVVMDARGEELVACLPERPFLVKPNRDELAWTVGHALTSDESLLQAMRVVNDAGAEWVLVTQGGRATWLTSLQRAYKLRPAAVEVVNPIGCGDSLAGGLSAALFDNAPIVDAVRFGMAAAADNAQQLLTARLDRQRVESLATQIQVETLH